MPWATDLLPHEIDHIKRTKSADKKKNVIHFVGTISGTAHGNEDCMIPFLKACNENGVRLIKHSIYDGDLRLTGRDDHIRFIQESDFAPIIVGPWQKEVGYLPCRAFKNVSYGQYPVTNSAEIHELFMKKAIYNEDTYRLFYDAQETLSRDLSVPLLELMDFVRDHHTYLNRIEHILNFFSTVYERC